MDAQLKRGNLDVCVLSALYQQDSYGYKIIQDLKTLIEISESTLYPILKRLESGNYLETYNTIINGRLRKMYKITSSGKEKLISYLEDYKQIIKIYNFIERTISHE